MASILGSRLIRKVSFVVAIAVAIPSSAWAQATNTDAVQWCQKTVADVPAPPPAQNIIVFVMDDTSAAILPTFAPPVQWPVSATPPTAPSGTTSTARIQHLARLRYEAQRRRPDMNRLAARIGATLGKLDSNTVPLDLNLPSATSVPDFTYSTTNAEPSRNTVAGVGGLHKLAKEGASFRRFYATAGVCAPTRASIMTGRYPDQVGVSANFRDLDENELTFAGFLRQMCYDGNADTHCYHTGMFGKWHLGNSARGGAMFPPWARGFEVALYDTENARGHWSNAALHCGPLEDDSKPVAPVAGKPLDGFFCTRDLLEAPTETRCTEPGTTSISTGTDLTKTIDFECSYGPTTSAFRYEQRPTPCDPTPNRKADQCKDSPMSAAYGSCVRWLPYLGPIAGRTACHPKDRKNPFCCNVGGADDKLSPVSSSRYRFSGTLDGKLKRDGTDAPLFTADRVCTNSALPFTSTGCRYDTRYYRDFAKNFIVRFGANQTTERFALYYGAHATHTVRSAPKGTLDHYETAAGATPAGEPLYPRHPKEFWASIEEVDAAVGQILRVLEGFCEKIDPQSPVTLPAYGELCTANSTCGDGGRCNTTLKDKTLVLFTSDQGIDESSFGEPWLREGKGSVYEGGIRVGLTAWSPGLQVGAGVDTSDNSKRMVDDAVGSQVDLFATIAHAAGCAPTAGDGLGYKVQICSDRTHAFCPTVGLTCGKNGTCVERTLEGRSLLPVISKTVRDAYAPTTLDYKRKLAFVRWSTPKDPDVAVIARRGYFSLNGGCEGTDCTPARQAAKVCTYHKEHAAVAGGLEDSDETAAIQRIRQGGSCSTCTTPAGCTTPALPCKVDGKFCVPSNRTADCSGTGTLGLCTPELWIRCVEGGTKECDPNHTCREVVAPCTHCEDASWKLTTLDNGTAHELYDVAGNPEEIDRLNCLDPVLYPTPPLSLVAVKSHLESKLDTWKSCITGPANDGRCDQ